MHCLQYILTTTSMAEFVRLVSLVLIKLQTAYVMSLSHHERIRKLARLTKLNKSNPTQQQGQESESTSTFTTKRKERKWAGKRGETTLGGRGKSQVSVLWVRECHFFSLFIHTINGVPHHYCASRTKKMGVGSKNDFSSHFVLNTHTERV